MGSRMAMVARFIEMQNTVEFFNNPQTLEACGIGGNKKMKPEDLLKDVRQYVNGREAETLDRAINFLNISKMYEKFNHLENTSDISKIMAELNPEFNNKESNNKENNNGDLINNLKNMLSPEQMQMFEALSAMNKQS